MADCELILGGARSGKSRLAEQRAQEVAQQKGMQLLYLATATPDDEEMTLRIEKHRSRRGKQWQLLEAPIALATALLNQSDDTCVVVDCLTLWLSNCLHQGCWGVQRQQLLDVLPLLSGHIIFVSNEVGSGIVPMGELSRQFVDESGFLHQQLAAQCDTVTLAVAGLPLSLKPSL